MKDTTTYNQSSLERYASSMGIQSYQIEQLGLSLHWQGQKCDLPGGQGIAGFKRCGGFHLFDVSQTGYLEQDWVLLLGYERSQGWVSISQLRAPTNLCINGHRLADGPLVKKESTFMLSPQEQASIELFLTESPASWCAAPMINRVLPSVVRDEHKKREQCTTITGLSLTHESDVPDCDAEYALFDADHNIILMDCLYSFGALRFEIEDEECWVFADDGVLFINGHQRVMHQIFVGDRLQWQEHCWTVIGSSTQRMTQLIDVQLTQMPSRQVQSTAIKSLVPAVQNCPLVAQISDVSSVVPVQQQKETLNSLEAEMAEFRQKLALWLRVQPGLTSAVDLPASQDNSFKLSPSEAKAQPKKYFSMLNLKAKNEPGHNKNSWQSEDDLQRQHLGSSEEQIVKRARSKVLLAGMLAIALIASSLLIGVVLAL